MNSQALKKPLKQECSVDLFHSVKGQPSVALLCWCIACDSGTGLNRLDSQASPLQHTQGVSMYLTPKFHAFRTLDKSLIIQVLQVSMKIR